MNDDMLHPQHVDNKMKEKNHFPRFVLQYEGKKKQAEAPTPKPRPPSEGLGTGAMLQFTLEPPKAQAVV
jgi:hypothetical protein